MSREISCFWRALETVVGLRAVRAAWRAALGPAAGWARPLIRPTTELAPTYPRLEPGGEVRPAYRVVHHARGDIVGVCPRGTGRIDLSVEELVIHELDVPALAERIATAMGLVRSHRAVPGSPDTYEFGLHGAGEDAETSVYGTFTPESRDLARTFAELVAGQERPLVLLTPTRSAWGAWPEALCRRGRVAAMDDVFRPAPASGELALTDAGLRLLPASQPSGRDPGEPAAKPEVAVATGEREAKGAGAGGPDVPNLDEQVILRVLAGSRVAMFHEAIATATAEFGRPLVRKTVGQALAAMHLRKWVDFPPNSRKGARILPAGRAALDRPAH